MFKTIQAERLAVMGKDKVKFNLLGVLIAEIQRSNLKEVPDTDVIKAIKKLLDSVNESISMGSKVEQSEVEKEILLSYLPKQLSEDELLTIMKELIQNDSSMKERKNMFPYLQKTYAGRYDSKLAGSLFGKL